MGEASRKKGRLSRLLETQPRCIYCGGVNAATTIDHMPPMVIFDQRHRPRGLEFPACEPCNFGGRLAEQVAGVMSRMYPNPVNDDGRRELQRLIRGVANNHPELIAEMVPTSAQRSTFARRQNSYPAGSSPLNARGPLLNMAMNTFAAKLAFAVHFEITNRVVSAAGIVAARWYTNNQVFTGDIPPILFDLVGYPGTLVQGRRNVADQFLYAGGYTPDRNNSVFVAQFRKSFAVAGIVCDDGRDVLDIEGHRVFRPGFLKT